MEKARGQVAKLIGADEKEVIFTSGATESNNLAIRGVAEFYKDRKNHIVTTVTEHKCVLDTCRHLEQNGFEVTYLPVQKNGLIDLEVLRNAITDKTVVVSIMAVNNEIGVIQPLEDRQDLPREEDLLPYRRGTGRRQDPARRQRDEHRSDEHFGPQNLRAQGHRCLLCTPQAASVRLVPLIVGGGQERGFRSGTLPTPLCVGLGEGGRDLREEEMEGEAKRLEEALQDRMLKGLNDKACPTSIDQRRPSRAPHPGATSTSASPMSRASR